LIRRAQDAAGGVVDDGVAAFEDLEGAAFVELQRRGFELPPPGNQQAVHAAEQFGGALLAHAPKPADARPQIERRKADMSGGEAAAFLSHQALETRPQSALVGFDSPPQNRGTGAKVEGRYPRARSREPLVRGG
jgi:hypothetical protein